MPSTPIMGAGGYKTSIWYSLSQPFMSLCCSAMKWGQVGTRLVSGIHFHSLSCPCVALPFIVTFSVGSCSVLLDSIPMSPKLGSLSSELM